MAVRRQIARYENKATEVGGKLFFNQSYSPKSSMRQAALKFAQTPNFTIECAYYDATMENGRWKFTPRGKRMNYPAPAGCGEQAKARRILEVDASRPGLYPKGYSNCEHEQYT